MLQNIKNTPSAIAQDARFSDRFQYWSGRSGRRYIFSIYTARACPPLPGAIYLAVRKNPCGARSVLAIGRMPQVWETAHGSAARLFRDTGADEIHVHLLADGEKAAESVIGDLKPALGQVARLRSLKATGGRSQPGVPAQRVLADSQIDLFKT